MHGVRSMTNPIYPAGINTTCGMRSIVIKCPFFVHSCVHARDYVHCVQVCERESMFTMQNAGYYMFHVSNGWLLLRVCDDCNLLHITIFLLFTISAHPC